MANKMTFKQVLGIAFKQWDEGHCLSMVEASEKNKNDKQYRLVANVAKYVLIKKFGLRVE